MTGITERALAIREMPRFGGHIIDPRFVPEPHRDAYLAQWGEYLRQTPRNRWEPWMRDLVTEIKRKNTNMGWET